MFQVATRNVVPAVKKLLLYIAGEGGGGWQGTTI